MEEAFERRQRALDRLHQAGALSLADANLLRGGQGVPVAVQGVQAVIVDVAYEPDGSDLRVTVSVDDNLGGFSIGDAEVGGYVTGGKRYATILAAWEAGIADCVLALAGWLDEV